VTRLLLGNGIVVQGQLGPALEDRFQPEASRWVCAHSQRKLDPARRSLPPVGDIVAKKTPLQAFFVMR
jgi:hypothetical protein